MIKYEYVPQPLSPLPPTSVRPVANLSGQGSDQILEAALRALDPPDEDLQAAIGQQTVPVPLVFTEISLPTLEKPGWDSAPTKSSDVAEGARRYQLESVVDEL